MKRSSISFFVALAFSTSVIAATSELPVIDKIKVGNGVINQSGNVLTINQYTDKLAINWKSFNIGQNSTVNFVQPSADSIALNRVIGSDVSNIQGKLNANGNVFLINPNGILFSPTAQVNVGGLLASTLNLSNKNFENDNFTFSGKSSNAIMNQGNIASTKFGIVMIAAKITNEGTLVANNGGDVLLGAGSNVTLDLGGPVKLNIKKAAIDALIDNGGAIQADGGLIYLTAKAANTLTTTVINNTGVIEAQTLATGEKGDIQLIGDTVTDRIVVGGKVDVSAPNGGDEGSVTINAAKVEYTEAADITLSAMKIIATAAELAATNAQNIADKKARAAEKAPNNKAKAKAAEKAAIEAANKKELAEAASNKLTALSKKADAASTTDKTSTPTVPTDPKLGTTIADVQKNPPSTPTSNTLIASNIKFQNILDTPTAAGGDEVEEQPSKKELIVNYLGDGINLPE
jgi:filamentous hemagglutinin family protein